MHLLVMGWVYVALMAAVAEAASSNGTLLGGALTFLLWGVLPLSIVVYLMAAPARRAARRAAEAAISGAGAVDPDDGSHATGDAVAPERKEP
jgi:hypothetical protein